MISVQGKTGYTAPAQEKFGNLKLKREPQASSQTQGGSRKPRNELGDIENPFSIHPCALCAGGSFEAVRAKGLLKTVQHAR